MKKVEGVFGARDKQASRHNIIIWCSKAPVLSLHSTTCACSLSCGLSLVRTREVEVIQELKREKGFVA